MDMQTHPCRQIHADTPLPPTASPPSPIPRRAGLTGSKALKPDVDYTHFSSSHFLPPSINPTSHILHLHYDGRLSPTLLIISSSFTSPPLPSLLTPLIFPLLTPSCVPFCHHTSSPSWPSASIFFISLVNFTLERDIQQVRY